MRLILHKAAENARTKSGNLKSKEKSLISKEKTPASFDTGDRGRLTNATKKVIALLAVRSDMSGLLRPQLVVVGNVLGRSFRCTEQCGLRCSCVRDRNKFPCCRTGVASGSRPCFPY